MKPTKISAWTAHATTKDFRDAKWKSKPIEPVPDAYIYKLPHPAAGYAAVFGEVQYQIDGHPLYLSTNIRIAGSSER